MRYGISNLQLSMSCYCQKVKRILREKKTNTLVTITTILITMKIKKTKQVLLRAAPFRDVLFIQQLCFLDTNP